MKTSDFDATLDEGNSILNTLDLSAAYRPDLNQKRVNVDIPVWMIQALDR